MNTHKAQSIPNTEAKPGAKPAFTRSYIVTVTGEPAGQVVGWGSRAHEIRHLEATLGPQFIEEVSSFYQQRLNNPHFAIMPVFEQKDGAAIDEWG